MKSCVVAVVLLSTFVLAKDASWVETTDSGNSKSSSLLSLQNRVDQLEKQLQYVKALGNCSTSSIYNDYKPIADMKPVFWLSGTFFDGFNEVANTSRSGLAPLTDVLGNPVTRYGSVAVSSKHGNMAYSFDSTNSITSTASINNKFTFVAVYRFPVAPASPEGRFFTSAIVGNRSFAGWNGDTQEWSQFNKNGLKSNATLLLMGTHDNGVKNLWSHDRQLVLNATATATAGGNNWGKVVIGRPVQRSNEAAQVTVYEAMIFDRVLDLGQRYKLLSVLIKAYGFK